MTQSVQIPGDALRRWDELYMIAQDNLTELGSSGIRLPYQFHRAGPVCARGCFHEGCVCDALNLGGATGFCRYAVETLWRATASVARTTR